MIRLAALLAAMATALPAADTIEAFGHRWTVPVGAEWTVEGSGPQQVLRMLLARPSTQPRRPTQFALADTPPMSEVTLECEVKQDRNSLIFVYAWRGENHFNYAHLSEDTAVKQPVHNGIFHVYGGDRVRISGTEGPESFPTKDWRPVKLVYSAKTGLVYVEVNGKALPSLRGVDLSLGAGRVGIGSFFETAQFRNVRITGK